MPKIFINYPEGAFPGSAMDLLAEEITAHAPALEQLPDTPYVRATFGSTRKNTRPEGSITAGKPAEQKSSPSK
jgi:hypothetical protein